MKGTIFIGWCVNNSLAIRVAEKLEGLGFRCIVGGNYSEYENSYIGGTIIKQLKSCNQAIFLISKNDIGLISNNIIFEIGFSFSKYNSVTKKTHLFYLDVDPKDQAIPSDLLGAWAHHISAESCPMEELSDDVVKLFLSNQKNSIEENKMDLVSSWYALDDMISKHYVEPQHSDYEMAQYFLFYAVSSGLLSIFSKMKDNLALFKKNVDQSSVELYSTLNLAEVMYSVDQSRLYEGNISYIDDITYFNAVTAIERLTDEMENYDDGGFENGRLIEYDFKKWFLMVAYQRIGYIGMTYANNPSIDAEEKGYVYKKSIGYQDKTIELCNQLRIENSSKNRELATQYRAFCYRNNSIAYNFFNDVDKSREFRLMAFEDHKFLHEYYKNMSLDSRLSVTLEREYYLLMAEILNYIDNPMQKRIYMKEIEAYTNYMLTVRDSTNQYVNRIKLLLESKETHGV